MRRCHLSSASLVLSLLLASPLLLAQSQAGAVYKWTDDKGVVHYTDAPPEGRTAERREVTATRPAAAAQGDEVPAGADGEPIADAAPKASADANCEIVRRNTAALAGGGSIAMDIDGDGKADVLTAEQRAAELQRAQQLIPAFCGAEVAAAAAAEAAAAAQAAADAAAEAELDARLKAAEGN